MVGQQVDDMANPEHLAKLKEGVEAWNRFRLKGAEGGSIREMSVVSREDSEHRNLMLPLPDSEITESGESGYLVCSVDLTDADLQGRDLRKVDLGWADLRRANLSDADLSEANLIAADLTEATLRGASLEEANLSDARLRATDFGKALIRYTIFGQNDLSTVRGLENVVHLGPSTIGIDTLALSKGNIPEKFLRGCGVPE